MSKLKAALAWAARGFPVFPLLPNDREPAFTGAWYDHATTDPDRIVSMWTDPVLRTTRDYNIGVHCDDMVVVDIDVKNGKDGYNEFMHITGGEWPDTLCVRTPSGGYHLYFIGPSSANAPISGAIDIRSHHGYVVAPGSTVPAGTYEVIQDVAPAWVPLSVERLLRPPYSRSSVDANVELDTEANVQAAINYLESTEPAVEGVRGDETTFITAARLVRELALSPHKAFELMRDHWNERCVPPWQLDELLRKVENAHEYASAELGRLDPALLFAAVHVEPPPSIFDQTGASWGNAVLPGAIRPRPWLIDRMLMLEKITLLLAAGSAGKSSITLALAAHLALGLDFGPYKTHKACKSIIYNGEDDVEEQSRRLLAVCLTYGFDYNTVRANVLLLSYEEVDMKLVALNGRIPVKNEAMINQLINMASPDDVGLLVLDPLVDLHYCDEGDSGHMNVVMSTLQDIAKRSNVAVLVPHHTTKAGSERQEARIGNMDISRGSSSIVYKARVAYTLMDASQQDAEDYGMQDSERHMWARLDDAKMNLSLKDSNALWFRKEGIRITSGDTVGVLKQQELTKSTHHLRIRLADLLIQTMTSNGTASMQMAQAVAVLKAGEPIYANKKDTEIRQRLESMFSTAVEIRGHTIRVTRETIEGKPDKVLITLS